MSRIQYMNIPVDVKVANKLMVLKEYLGCKNWSDFMKILYFNALKEEKPEIWSLAVGIWECMNPEYRVMEKPLITMVEFREATDLSSNLGTQPHTE